MPSVYVPKPKRPKKRRIKDEIYWHLQLKRYIPDEALRAWCARIIWWDYCKLTERRGWRMFADYYERLYEHYFVRNKLSEVKLQDVITALSFIGYNACRFNAISSISRYQ